jgi:selenide,water dikinase
VLRPLQGIFNPSDYPDLLVGLGDPDDAAVWRLDDQRALVATTDFFTPVVDDAYDYGAIAAANALSDVYAMGGKPFLALNITAMPPDLPAEMISAILRGGDTARLAGVVIAGAPSRIRPPPGGAGDLDPRACSPRWSASGDRWLTSRWLRTTTGAQATRLRRRRGGGGGLDEAPEPGCQRNCFRFWGARRDGYHRLQPAGARQ